jgi:hypothetical protein
VRFLPAGYRKGNKRAAARRRQQQIAVQENKAYYQSGSEWKVGRSANRMAQDRRISE